jgi:hypothetical protein
LDVIFHADDFGINPKQSHQILSCADKGGLLNSTSIFVTSPHFEECAMVLAQRPKDMRVGLHINLVEGPCCADPTSIPMLVDAQGIFRLSFAGILAASMGSSRQEFARELACELDAQLDRFEEHFPELHSHLRIDGHQHVQLIPAVFNALMSSVQRRGATLEYLRVPAEPLTPFLNPKVFFGIRPINWVKHWLLNFLWRLDRKSFPDYQHHSAIFCGVLFSGCMNTQRVQDVFSAYLSCARRRKMNLEFLFHPGGIERVEDCLNPKLSGFTAFYASDGRQQEAAALHELELIRQADGMPTQLKRR